MNKFLYIYNKESFIKNIFPCVLDIEEKEGDYISIYNSISNKLDIEKCIIFDINSFDFKNNLFEFITFFRLSRASYWDIPIFIFLNKDRNVNLLELFQEDKNNILKTKRIEFINSECLRKDELSGELILNQNLNIKLKETLIFNEFINTIIVKGPNLNNHSIANEWGIYRWSKTLNIIDSDIECIINKIQTNIFFKYLQAIYPISNTKTINLKELKIDTTEKPKFLYIDDEAGKGWYKIFCNILYDINNFDFDQLEIDFKSISRKEIVNQALEKIKEQDSDIVLLDFRLHPEDLNEKEIKNVTGLQVLRAIKTYNPGIQVIMISATNKIWNLQELQIFGIDGFIIKESPENSIDADFTLEIIRNTIKIINNCLEKIFIKRQFINYNEIENALKIRTDYKRSKNPLDKNFVFEILKWLKLSIEINMIGNIESSKVTTSFIFLFSVLENLTNSIIDVDNKILIKQDNNHKSQYSFEFRSNSKKIKNFIEKNDRYIKQSEDYTGSQRIPWHIKILNTLDFIGEENYDIDKLSDIIRKRNNLIHSNTTTGKELKIYITDIIWLHNLLFIGLKKI